MIRLLLIFLLLPTLTFSQVNLGLGLMAHYPFDGNANDISGNNNNPVFNNATPVNDRFGNVNGAYRFNGINNYMRILNSSTVSTGNQISLCVWAKPMGFSMGQCHGSSLIDKGTTDFLPGNYFVRYSDAAFTNNQHCNIPTPDIDHQNFLANNAIGAPGYTPFIQLNNWYLIVYTYDGLTERLYVNCELKVTLQTPGMGFTNNTDLYFGRFFNGSHPYWYEGDIDEIRIYNRALNEAEIFHLANGQTVDATGDATICSGDSVQLNVTGGSNFSWSPSTGLSDPSIANPMATPTVTTTYYLTSTFPLGCNVRDSVRITVNPSPLLVTSDDTLLCSLTPVQLFASGANQYSWTPVNTLNSATSPTPVASPAATTTYYVTGTNPGGCSKTDSVKVEVRSTTAFIINPASQICENGSVSLMAAGGDTYSWTPAGSLSNPAIANPLATPDSTTTYSVAITDTVCNNTSALSTTVTVFPFPDIAVSKSNDIDCNQNQSQLSATGALSFTWTPAGSLNNASIPNPIATPSATTEYTVTGMNLPGCSDTKTITVEVNAVNTGNYLMPTAFTPNADGLNDCFQIKYWGLITELEFNIYNQFGQRVFYTTNPTACWDGTYRLKKQNPGVYVYMIKAKTSCEPEVFRKGTFLLIR